MTKLSKDSPESAILGLGFGTVWVTTELRVTLCLPSHILFKKTLTM